MIKRETRPMRDKYGRFIIGHKGLIRPKYLYGQPQNYPKLICDTCYAGKDCAEYKKGCVCAYKKEFKKFDTRNVDVVMNALADEAEYDFHCLQNEMIIERIEGKISDEVTKGIDKIMMNSFVLLWWLYKQTEKSKSIKSPVSDELLRELLNEAKQREKQRYQTCAPPY